MKDDTKRIEAIRKLKSLRRALTDCGIETELIIKKDYIMLDVLDVDISFNAIKSADFEIYV